MAELQKPEAQAVAEIVEKYIQKSQLLDIAHPEDTALKAQVLLTPNGMGGLLVSSVKKSLDEYRKTPEFKHGIAAMKSLDSFIDHVNRFKDDDSAVFADPGDFEKSVSPSLTAVLDYHRKSDGAPRFGKHRTVYEFPLSDEWKAWSESSDVAMEQGTFAHFIEDRLLDVVDPATLKKESKAFLFAEKLGVELANPARLLELSRGLLVRVNQTVLGALNTSTGEAAISFETTHGDKNGAPLKVPGAFAITIPVFKLDRTFWTVPVRLKYRVDGGRVVWTLSLYRTDITFADAFDLATAKVLEKTQIPLLMGAPER